MPGFFRESIVANTILKNNTGVCIFLLFLKLELTKNRFKKIKKLAFGFQVNRLLTLIGRIVTLF